MSRWIFRIAHLLFHLQKSPPYLCLRVMLSVPEVLLSYLPPSNSSTETPLKQVDRAVSLESNPSGLHIFLFSGSFSEHSLCPQSVCPSCTLVGYILGVGLELVRGEILPHYYRPLHTSKYSLFSSSSTKYSSPISP